MNNREAAIRQITLTTRKKREEIHPFKRFSENVFNERFQKESLSNEVFQSLKDTVKTGTELDPKIADSVALAMKEWALERGATHFCHWFQPLTVLTAEKHGTLFAPEGEVGEFSGKMLIRGEADPKSFSSGSMLTGRRTTFEGRGYTAWDPSSPPFILGRTLVIPSIFLSWGGDALDKKTPLLRSMEALNTQALRVLRLFGDQETKRVTPTVGAEQEYFLIDQHFYHLRPDLHSTNRTLYGAKPSKGQEFEDQYVDSLCERVSAVLEETEFELMQLGVPVKTRHNEMAPAQHEIALSFQKANLAADHHMLLMEMLKRVAKRHGMVTLFHEKPFAGINGSGKHLNWSMTTDHGKNLLDPGETPEANAQFLLFCAAFVRGVHKYASQLGMAVATPGNDLRLGLQEAPPAIISLFLGSELQEIFKKLIHKADYKLGLSMLPQISSHTGDRNRTAPLAFTGNKFEFRSVGASENIARAATVLNTIVAESLDFFATELEKAVHEKENFYHALQILLAKVSKEFQPVIFEGDHYDENWTKEAEKRQLPILKTCVDAAAPYSAGDTVALFTKYKVFSRRELASRQEILLRTYVKKVVIEAREAANIAHTMILPAAVRYVGDLGEVVSYLEHDLIKGVAKEILLAKKSLKALDEAIHRIPQEILSDQAEYARDKILPAMQTLRIHVDTLEGIISDRCWPLPKYREMLFIR